MYPKIQWRQVIMNALHPSCARPPQWSPPVLWRRFEDGLASIFIADERNWKLHPWAIFSVCVTYMIRVLTGAGVGAVKSADAELCRSQQECQWGGRGWTPQVVYRSCFLLLCLSLLDSVIWYLVAVQHSTVWRHLCPGPPWWASTRRSMTTSVSQYQEVWDHIDVIGDLRPRPASA